MRFRFSLRWLFLATVIVAICCYWLVLPTIIAQRFVGAIASANYERADACFVNPDDRFLFVLNDNYWRFHVRADLQPWSVGEFMSRKRFVQLHVAFGDAGPVRSESFTVIATQAGCLLTPMISGGSSGLGGLADIDLRSPGYTL